MTVASGITQNRLRLDGFSAEEVEEFYDEDDDYGEFEEEGPALVVRVSQASMLRVQQDLKAGAGGAQ